MADAAPSAAEMAAILASVKELLATVFIGFTIALVLYGISCLQTYLYYRHYQKDPWYLKLTVAAFWSVDTFITILVAHSLYTYMILNILDPAANLTIPWSFVVENEVVDILTFMTQIYFAIQLWKLPTSRIYCLFIFALAIAPLALSIPLTDRIFQSHRSAAALATPHVFVLGSVGQGLLALCDICITAGLIYYLQGWRGGIRQTTVIIDNLILYAVTRGTLTAICQLMFMILNVAMPSHTFWQPFHLAVGKLYVNSVLASLNFRATEETGSPAFPLGKAPQSTTLAEFSSLEMSPYKSTTTSQSVGSRMAFADSRPQVTTFATMQTSNAVEDDRDTSDGKHGRAL